MLNFLFIQKNNVKILIMLTNKIKNENILKKTKKKKLLTTVSIIFIIIFFHYKYDSISNLYCLFQNYYFLSSV